MIRQMTLLLVFVNLCCVASANEFRTNFRQGVKLLQEGDAEKALEIFQDLMVEHPTNQDVQYALGCTHSALAAKYEEQNRREEASKHRDQASLYFEKASDGNKNLIRQYAQYNKANLAARYGLNVAKMGEYNSAIEKMKAAVDDYEHLLQRYPEYHEAAQNRDHISYQLKRLLQNPPPENQEGENKDKNQENQESEETEESQSPESQNNKANNNQEPKSSEQHDEYDDNHKDEENSQNEKQPDTSQSAKSPQHSSGQQNEDNDVSLPPINDDVERSDLEQKRAQLETSKNQKEPLNPDSIQAILDSLEQRDQEEQRERREVQVREQAPEQWW